MITSYLRLMRHSISAGSAVLCLCVLSTVTCAQTPTTRFSGSVDWTVQKIRILPVANRGLFKPSEAVTIETTDNSSITVYDLYGETVYSGPSVARTYGPGHYFVECSGDRNQFAVFPDDYAGASFMGDIGYDGYVIGGQRQARLMPGWLRTGAGGWNVVEAQQGGADWTRMDATIASRAGRNIIAIAASDQVPDWIQPADLIPRYLEHLTALVQRYPGQIRAIEFWNEPDIHQFWHDPEWTSMLSDLMEAGRAAVKAIDPSILLVGPSWSSVGRFTGTAVLGPMGLNGRIDRLCWHDYWAYRSAPDLTVEVDGAVLPDVMERCAWHRERALYQGPLFISELGLLGQSALGFPTPQIHPSYTGGPTAYAPEWDVSMMRSMKYAVMYRAAGADLISVHLLSLEPISLTDQQTAIYGWDYGPRGPSPKTSAFVTTCSWLEGAQLVDYRLLGGELALFAWRRPDNTSLVFAWTTEGHSVPLTLNNAASLEMTDVYGRVVNPSMLTEFPILFHSASADTASMLQMLMADLPSPNRSPALRPLSNKTIYKGQTLRFTAQATDPDNDPLLYSSSVLPPGAVLNPSSGEFSWTPTAGQIGSYAITLTVTDARGLEDSTSTLVTVIGTSTDGLAAWWTLDETAGTVASDQTGANPGSLNGFGPGGGGLKGR